MRNYLCLAFLFLMVAPAVWAQEVVPKYEVFVGGSYAREDVNDIQHINGVGWHASVEGTGTSWVSAVFDFSGYYSSPKVNFGLRNPIPIDSSTYLYLFGPRFNYRRGERLKLFGEGLLGIGDFGFTASSVGLTNKISSKSFAAGFGGGADYAVTSAIAVRLFEIDYVPTRFREIFVNPDTGLVSFNGPRRTQNNVRASVGIVLRFGNR